MPTDQKITLQNARPYAFAFPPSTTAFVVIDMQQNFLDPDGFRSVVCGNPAAFSSIHKIVPNICRALDAARQLGLHIVYTREGHLPNLVDFPASKSLRQTKAPNSGQSMGIGDEGPMRKLLVRREKGHGIIDELRPCLGDLIIDKPGKGSFWGTRLHRLLLARGVTHLMMTGVTTECCVTSTLREGNDRGYECCVLSDCTEGFDERMVATSLDIVCCQNGPFGYVGHSSELIALAEQTDRQKPSLSYAEHVLEATVLPSITELKDLYTEGLLNPETVIRSVLDRIARYEAINPAVWISREDPELILEVARSLFTRYAGNPLPPLFGIPFAIKDNIDVQGERTTAACEWFRIPSTTAPSVQHLLDAGAILIGKLNMDQLATGLTGCRSPSAVHNHHSKKHIAGGSSSGSAIAVAAGLVSFAIGTDTAGSVRVPAAFHGIVGFKPTKGTISARGVVPACRSLDTIGILAPSLEDARQAWYVMDQYDALDPYAKPPESLPTWLVDYRGPREGGFTFGIPPDSLIKLCSTKYQELFKRAVDLLQSCGGTLVEIDYTPFAKAGDLIYGSSLVHERLASVGRDFIKENINTFHPTTKTIYKSLLSSKARAWKIFRDQATQMECIAGARKTFNKLNGGIDVLVVPTVPSHPTIQEVLERPLELNTELGVFTHFANVVDLCGVSVNAGWVEEGGTRLPFGITFLSGSGCDGKVLDIAAMFEEQQE